MFAYRTKNDQYTEFMNDAWQRVISLNTMSNISSAGCTDPAWTDTVRTLQERAALHFPRRQQSNELHEEFVAKRKDYWTNDNS